MTNKSEPERLQKILARAGVASRREAEQMILDGRIKVDGQIVKILGTKVDASKQKIFVDGKLLKELNQKFVYFLLNKPKGYVSTVKDEQGRKTVLDLLSEEAKKFRLFPVGRLDQNTEGLLLLTNDGELTNKLLHPSNEIFKRYAVTVEGRMTQQEMQNLADGVQLEDGMTAPCDVIFLEYDNQKNRTRLEMVLHEGKNREIRRMCEAVGHSVHSLKRIAFAGFTLQGLPRGKYRSLQPNEIKYLQNLVKR